jgi:hypothetical protein
VNDLIHADGKASTQSENETGSPADFGCNSATPALAKEPNVLQAFVESIEEAGLVGEARAAQLTFLSVTSRFLDRPVSIALKGPSAVGKSFVVERTLRFFPPEAYYTLSSMSDRALAYLEEPLSHRTLVIYEASGLESDMVSYLVRSLLSEGHIRHSTVESTKNGLRSKLLELEGPTGLIVTTTAVKLHAENETRLLSIPVADSPEQTSRVLRALAGDTKIKPDYSPWHGLQRYLSQGEHRVTVPYALTLAKSIPPLAVRLRRDFEALLNLIRTNAILHQATRPRDSDGKIVASLDDYSTVWSLVADLVAEGIEATVSAGVHEAVEAVQLLRESDTHEAISVSRVAKKLGIDRSSASRRISVALDRGYLKNLERTKGKPFDLILGDPLPEEIPILPSVESLEDCCTVAADSEWGEPIDYEDGVL